MNKATGKKIMMEIFGWVRDIAIAVIVALLITRFVITHTVIPTGSMIPTIGINDHLVINRVPLYFSDPKAGEVVVFHHGNELIKRIVGVPGDVIDFEDGDLLVNGKPLDEPYLYEQSSSYPFLLDEMQYPLELEEDMYFLMGDNRNNSEDSRYFGPIHREHIYAKSGLRIWPLNNIGFLE